MARYAKRGRPRLAREQNDTGTPELRAKRQCGLTLEPLDLALRSGLISADEHRAGMHLRWLYTLKFGAPTVRSVEFDRVAGAREHALHDDAWKARREQEYNEAVEALSALRAKHVVMDVCIFHRWPDFLHSATGRCTPEHQRFREGMRWMVKQWRR